MEIWPQVKSALPWDAAAITTYFTVSLLFWYLGMLPDLAALRLGAAGEVAAIVVACAKVSVVAVVFMELGHAGTAVRVVAAITVAFVALLCLGILADVMYR